MRHIVFIDDHPTVLSGLERMLYPMRAQWRMTFVPHPGAALEILEADPADVVIADMQMPDLDGAELLREVRANWPDTVRIILSGYADDGAALRSVPVAHQFLAKPCDPEILATTVRDACSLRERLTRPDLREMIGRLSALPSPPRLFSALTEALGQPEVHLGKVAAIIKRDPGCSSKLLQLVNSSFFGVARRVTRIDEAVAYLGVARVRDVVLAVEATAAFQPSTPALARLAQEISDHGLGVALVARQQVRARYAHDVFMAGVLHDIGRLVLAVNLPEVYHEIEQRRLAGESLCELERERFGTTHAEVGAYLLRLWGLPLTLIDAVARHHDPESPDAVDSPVTAALSEAVAQMESDDIVLVTAGGHHG